MLTTSQTTFHIPLNRQWWLEIMYGTGEGNNCLLKLAGHVVVPGVMTKLGEVMTKEEMRRHDYDIAWIRPVSRMRERLGIAARWRGDGAAALIYPAGDTYELIKAQGLACTEWEHCWPIRVILSKSHLKRKTHYEPQNDCSEHVGRLLQQLRGGTDPKGR